MRYKILLNIFCLINHFRLFLIAQISHINVKYAALRTNIIHSRWMQTELGDCLYSLYFNLRFSGKGYLDLHITVVLYALEYFFMV